MIKVKLTAKEESVINELSERLEVSPEGILKKGLALYQMFIEGKVKPGDDDSPPKKYPLSLDCYEIVQKIKARSKFETDVEVFEELLYIVNVLMTQADNGYKQMVVRNPETENERRATIDWIVSPVKPKSTNGVVGEQRTASGAVCGLDGECESCQ